MQVFKFGGASVKDAEAVNNVGKILTKYADKHQFVVISAMGKTTNALETLVKAHFENDRKRYLATLNEIRKKHTDIALELCPKNNKILIDELEALFDKIAIQFDAEFSDNYDYEYDQMVSLGEILSTKIIAYYLQTIHLNVCWEDARNLIRTDRTFRNAEINWEITKRLVQKCAAKNTNKIIITQGFIGHTDENLTTTLGREGSDYTAAILAFCSDSKNVTIWKDVPGMLNADPKFFKDTVKLDQISFEEAIELAYYGASVIHPKTIQPLRNKSIPLYVKSFNDPEASGTLIHNDSKNDDKIASYIFKKNQILISVIPRDFSFINEAKLEVIFKALTKENVTINIMQNSAVSFSFLVDAEKVRLDTLLKRLDEHFDVRYNENLELITIRHYNQNIIDEIVQNRVRLLTQMDRTTIRMVLN